MQKSENAAAATNAEFRVGLFSIKCELIWDFMDNIDGDLNAHVNISWTYCKTYTAQHSQ